MSTEENNNQPSVPVANSIYQNLLRICEEMDASLPEVHLTEVIEDPADLFRDVDIEQYLQFDNFGELVSKSTAVPAAGSSATGERSPSEAANLSSGDVVQDDVAKSGSQDTTVGEVYSNDSRVGGQVQSRGGNPQSQGQLACDFISSGDDPQEAGPTEDSPSRHLRRNSQSEDSCHPPRSHEPASIAIDVHEADSVIDGELNGSRELAEGDSVYVDLVSPTSSDSSGLHRSPAVVRPSAKRGRTQRKSVTSVRRRVHSETDSQTPPGTRALRPDKPSPSTSSSPSCRITPSKRPRKSTTSSCPPPTAVRTETPIRTRSQSEQPDSGETLKRRLSMRLRSRRRKQQGQQSSGVRRWSARY